MNYLIKLLKSWTNPADQKEYKAGDVIETDDKDLAADLLLNGIGEKSAPAKSADADSDAAAIVKSAAKEAVAEAMKAADEKAVEEKKALHIEAKDKSDYDPSHGYLPERIGDKWSDDEKTWGFSNFCSDVYHAGNPSIRQLPAGLKNAQERSEKMIKAAIEKGYVQKASGDLQQAAVDSDGGFLIPPEFSTMLLDRAMVNATIRPRATTMQIGSDRIELPMAKNYDHSSNLIHGGLQAYWKAEDAQLTESKVTFEEIALNLNALTILAKVTHKMMRFSPVAVGSYLLPKMADAITWKEEDGFINGTGAGMPLGMLSAPSKVSIAIESGQTLAATAIVTKNVLKMYQQLKVERPSSVAWLYNRVDAFYWLALLKVDVGTGGSHVGLMTRMPNSPENMLLGLPLLDNEHCQALGTVGDFFITDLSQYIIADDRKGPEVAQSMHLNFDYGKENYRIIKYVDAQPMYSSTFSRQNATNSSASVVTLAARS